jgi:mono/diheme cytochrome c family protein
MRAGLTVLAGAAVLTGTAAGLAQEAGFSDIERGRYLARVGDCVACHTAEGGEPFAGNRPIPTPFGTLYSANITPDRETGIGGWSDAEFERAMTQGMAPGGKRLYPAFPYPFFTKVTRDDIRAIKAWLDTLEPVRQEVDPPELPWPLSWRALLAGWNALFFEEGVFTPDPGMSAEWNRGAYLVEGLGHCAACHSPKNLAGAVELDEAFEGGFGEGWFAPDLTGDLREGLGEWSVEDIVEYLKTGSNRFSSAGGPMAEVVERSTQHLTREDLRAMAVYLEDLPAAEEVAEPGHVRDLDELLMAEGEALFVDNCTGCHLMSGEGQEGVFPALAGSSVLQQEEPHSAIQIVLGGAEKPSTEAKPTPLAMPAFGWKLDDDEVAALLTYLRTAFGNRASPVERSTVTDVRSIIEEREGTAALASE